MDYVVCHHLIEVVIVFGESSNDRVNGIIHKDMDSY